MRITHQKAGELYDKLESATTAGKVVWTRASKAIKTELTDTITASYFTQFGGDRLALLAVNSRSYDGENDEWITTPGIQLSILDNQDRISFTFPYSREIDELLQAVQAQTSDAANVLERLLKNL